MIRSNPLVPARGDSRRSGQRFRYAALLEPLEQRQMLDAAYINEVYLDPPSSSDSINEYIELRGTPGMSLDDTYLLIIENENNNVNTGAPGEIEKIFSLDGQLMGSSGFLTLRRAGNPYTVAPGTTELFYSGDLENSGFTAMLIQTDGTPAIAPQLNFDLDVGNNGLDVPTGRAGWTILDSIGIHGESGEAAFGRLYGEINFGPESSTNIEPGATYVGVGYEIEYIGRWGNSTGQTADDWHISNLTDNALSGFTGTGDFRQSADPHGSTNVESNKEVPYGTNLTNTLGAPNLGPATEVFVNEIYLDPPSSSDSFYEYIELRGTPSLALDDYYLVIVENENDVFNEGGAGEVERVFDLTGQSLGSNGYLVMHQSGHPYSIAPGTTEIIYTGALENSGFTAMLIKNNGGAEGVPFVSDITPLDLDTNNNGLDVASGLIVWDVKDSIGLHSESDEIEFGLLYGAVNFGPGPNGVPINNYHNVGYEIEYVGRWGNSTGSDESDWHASNLTDNPASGYTGTGDFRQSGEPHGVGAPGQIVETNRGVPYGTNLTNTLGADNYPENASPTPTIADRHIFYNQSQWDGNSAAISPVNDNAAIAPDKDPYLPNGTTAISNNVSSFSRGIDGIMVDISAGGSHAAITASDFIFKVGNNNTPSSWAAAPAPTGLSVVIGGGVGGSDRVIITFASGVIKNQWLEVQVKATTNTGLAATDVHFWGNRIGDSGTGTPATNFQTSATDQAQVLATVGVGKPITDLRDFNRDKAVNATDSAIVLANVGLLNRLNVAAIGPFAPEADPAADDGGSAVASALAAPKGIDLGIAPKSNEIRANSYQVLAEGVVQMFGQLSETRSIGNLSPLTNAHLSSGSLVSDDILIDSLLDELGLS